MKKNKSIRSLVFIMLSLFTCVYALEIKGENTFKVSELYGTKTLQDTIRFSGSNVLKDFIFIMKDKNAKPEDLYANASGELFFNTNQPGYFRTNQVFENYKLHIEWKWPEKTVNGNSGILIHTQLPDSVWPKCVQVQIKQLKAGDLIAMNGALFNEAKGKPKDTAEKLSEPSEKEEGEWNHCDIICYGDSIVVYINGILQNKATNVNIIKGTIGFQLEGKPLYFRNIYLVR